MRTLMAGPAQGFLLVKVSLSLKGVSLWVSVKHLETSLIVKCTIYIKLIEIRHTCDHYFVHSGININSVDSELDKEITGLLLFFCI